MQPVRTMLLLALLALLSAGQTQDLGALGTQTASQTLTASMPAKVSNREMQPIAEGTWRGLRLDAKPGDGVAWWPDVQFGNGTIELEILGKNVPQQSFVGVAFHGQDEKTFDAIYFRPFNFKATDPTARSHAVQYVSHPVYTWNKLRSEHPGQYEHAIAPVPEPDAWFHARVVLAYPSVRVYVNDGAEPTLDVKQISERKSGWVGVWVGNNSDGAFANLLIRSAP